MLTEESLLAAGAHGIIVTDWPLFIGVGSQTAYTGDVIALVIANSASVARQAADLIDVSYSPSAPITDVTVALRSEPAVQGTDDNLVSLTQYRCEESSESPSEPTGFVAVDEVFRTQRVEHAFLEPEAVLAVPDGSGLNHAPCQGSGIAGYP